MARRPVTRLRAAAWMCAAALVAACDAPTDPAAGSNPGPQVPSAGTEGVRLEIDAARHAAGDRLALVLTRGGAGSPSAPVAVSGVLTWNPSTHRWVGQVPVTGAPILVGTDEVDEGRLRFAGYALAELDRVHRLRPRGARARDSGRNPGRLPVRRRRSGCGSARPPPSDRRRSTGPVACRGAGARGVDDERGTHGGRGQRGRGRAPTGAW